MTDFDDVLADVLDDDLDHAQGGDLDEALGGDFAGDDPDLAGIDLAELGLEDDEEGGHDPDVDLETDDVIPADGDDDNGVGEVVASGDATALVEKDDLLDELEDEPPPLERDLDVDDEVREGEFVCRSCFMAKRESALADEELQLCRDCV